MPRKPVPPKIPFEGAVVLYVDPHMGDVYPAIVARVLVSPQVILTAFQPGATPFPVRGAVEFDVLGTKKGTWHWPKEPT